MSLAIFKKLPDLPKRLIVTSLLKDLTGVELTARSLPISWLFSRPNEEIETETCLETGPCLWVDVQYIQNKESDHTHRSILVGLLLATYWRLINVVYFWTCKIEGWGNNWERLWPQIPQISRVKFADFKVYLQLCANTPTELDPFIIKQYRDIVYKLGCKWGQGRLTDSLSERLSRREFKYLLGRFAYFIWFVGNNTPRLQELTRVLLAYREESLTRLYVANYFLSGDPQILEQAQLTLV